VSSKKKEFHSKNQHSLQCSAGTGPEEEKKPSVQGGWINSGETKSAGKWKSEKNFSTRSGPGTVPWSRRIQIDNGR